MNWTGGNLSRHSRPTGSLESRQKQHFAKIRLFRRRKTQEATSLSERRKKLLDQSRESEKCPTVLDTDLEPLDELNRSYPSVYMATEAGNADFDEIPDDDILNNLHDRTANSLDDQVDKRKRKHDLLVDQQPERKECGVNADLIRRKKLLQQNDWVGINFQRPIELKHSKPMYLDEIGKRRRLSHNYRASHITQPQSSHASSSTFLHTQSPSNEKKSSSTNSISSFDHGIRVFIGDNETSQNQSLDLNAKRNQSLEIPWQISSDIMLLDSEPLTNQLLSDKEAVIPERQRKKQNLASSRTSSLCRDLPINSVGDGRVAFSSPPLELRYPRPGDLKLAQFLRSALSADSEVGSSFYLGARSLKNPRNERREGFASFDYDEANFESSDSEKDSQLEATSLCDGDHRLKIAETQAKLMWNNSPQGHSDQERQHGSSYIGSTSHRKSSILRPKKSLGLTEASLTRQPRGNACEKAWKDFANGSSIDSESDN